MLAIDYTSSITPAQLGIFIILLAAAGGIYIRFRKFEDRILGKADKREIQPQPLEVIEAQRPTPMSEHVKLEQTVRQVIEQRREDVKILHRKIESGQEQLRAQVKQDIDRVNERIDAIPERTISLLKETKHLIE